MSTKLRIVPAAGRPIEIDPQVAGKYSGNAQDALQQIIRNEIRDPQLLALLADPRVSLEKYTQDESGNAHEAVLHPGANWAGIIEELQHHDVEVGMAKTLTGGYGYRQCGESGSGLDRSPASLLDTDTQEFVQLPERYSVTEEDKQASARGERIFITGAALAAAEAICRFAGSSEILWFWTGHENRPEVISGVAIPMQQASAGWCSAIGHEILRINRMVRRAGRFIIGSGHSHGMSSVFSSSIDLRAMADLAQQRVGFVSDSQRLLQGTVSSVQDSGAEGKGPADPPAEARLAVTFGEGSPEIAARISTRRADIAPGDLRVELACRQQRIASLFSTHNSRCEHLLPLFAVTMCPVCGGRGESPKPSLVPVHVIGPKRLSKKQGERLRLEVDSKVQPGYRSYQNSQAYLPADEKHAEDFEVCRHGRLIGYVPAVAMEKAAHHVKELAQSLGWYDEKPRVDQH